MAGIAETDRLAVFDDVRHDQHFRIVRQLELMQHMNLQRTEAAAEGDLLIRRDALVAKHQHVMIQMRAVNARKSSWLKRLAQIEAEHFGTERAVESANFDGLTGNGAVARGPHGSRWAAVGSKGCRHRKLFVESGREAPAKRSQTNVPARARADNEANPILLSAGVINPML
jgi:hypothetical protein